MVNKLETSSIEYLLHVQALLQSQTETADEAKQAFTVSEAKNGELTKKIEDADKKVDELQDSVQRFLHKFCICLS